MSPLHLTTVVKDRRDFLQKSIADSLQKVNVSHSSPFFINIDYTDHVSIVYNYSVEIGNNYSSKIQTILDMDKIMDLLFDTVDAMSFRLNNKLNNKFR